VSTHLYQSQRLSREHLIAIGANGFDRLELFATRTHVDYHNPSAIADIQQWMAEAGLELESVHAPVAGSFAGGRWVSPMSLASPDKPERERAVSEIQRALEIARRIPFRTLIVHLGWPRPTENSRDAARRSLNELCGAAETLGVTVAIEVLQNELSRASSLVHFIEEALDTSAAAICLDCGHAHADGDVVDAIETVSEHLAAVHLNDNQGNRDEHLIPFEGSIDWPGVLTEVQKVGYDGTLTFEVAPSRGAKDALKKAAQARDRMKRLLA
jgi:sugar phosphate isomerase/epimerase